MSLNLSKKESWRAEIYDEPQILVYFEILSIKVSQGKVSEQLKKDVENDVRGWAPNGCYDINMFDDENRKKFSYASNVQNGAGQFFQKAVGRWQSDFKLAMSQLKLELVGVDGQYKLIDANPTTVNVESWRIDRWEVQYDVVTNPFSAYGDKKKLFCDDVTWVKRIGTVDVTIITRHGWREY